MSGVLYVVATPIGHLADISFRALEILKSVHIIYAEDTRHSEKLCRHYGISTPRRSLHSFNEYERVQEILTKLKEGQSIALISDAGTPLISDPGYPLIHAARQTGIIVSPIPGPCALIAALSASGIPCDRFCFEGFLPAKSKARREALAALSNETRSIVFYEAPHRLLDTLQDIALVLGEKRLVCLAREMTKKFETFITLESEALAQWIEQHPEQCQGECVLIVSGVIKNTENPIEVPEKIEISPTQLLKELMVEMPLKQAAALIAKITGLKKNALYKWGIRFEPDK